MSTHRAHEATVLAGLRLVLAAVGLVAIYLDPTQPSHYAGLVYGVLAGYVIFSATTVVVATRRPGMVLRAAVPLHCTDLVVTAALTLFTEGVSSPFFVFFTFLLLSAAWQWGLRQTLVTAFATLALLASEAVLAASLFGPSPIQLGEFELNRFIVRSVYLLLLALIVGRFADAEKDMRRREAATTDLLGRVLAQNSVAAATATAVGELLLLFGGTAVQIVAWHAGGPRFLWCMRNDELAGDVTWRELPERGLTPDFDVSADCWRLRRIERDRGEVYELATAEWTRFCRRPVRQVSLPPAFTAAYEFESAICASLTLPDEWNAQVLLFDPDGRVPASVQMPFFYAIVQHSAPVVHSVYLARRLRSRVTAVERARLARELHDGVIQSLLALDLHIEGLRRQKPGHESTGDQLAEVQRLVKQETMAVRDLMQELRTISVGPAQLIHALADMADRLEQQTGIRVRFVSDVNEVCAPPQVCREVARVFQEALANIRKHSGAVEVRAQLSQHGSHLRLAVEDDGHGFDFAGRLTLDQLDAARRGPLVIKERVRAIGGTLVLESDPGRGSRLEIRFPSIVDTAPA